MTTKQQRRNNGVQNVVAAQKRSNNKTVTTAAPAAPAAAATEQAEVLTVKLDASPVNSVPAAPAEPAAAPEVPVVPEDPKAAAEPAAPAAPVVQGKVDLIATGLKTLLELEAEIPFTLDGLKEVALDTAIATLAAVLADEKKTQQIREAKASLIGKANKIFSSPQAEEKSNTHCTEDDLRKMGMSLDDVYL